MPCCCQTNLQATFVIGIISLVLGCLAFIFNNYAGGIGIVVGICYIVGAKLPNSSAILVGMIFACINCIGMIINAIILIVGGGIVATTSTADFKSNGADLNTVKASGLAIVIVGVLYTVGVIIFQIWTIIVANKARKEIDEGIKI